jgi:hypothetical protein
MPVKWVEQLLADRDELQRRLAALVLRPRNAGKHAPVIADNATC